MIVALYSGYTVWGVESFGGFGCERKDVEAWLGMFL